MTGLLGDCARCGHGANDHVIDDLGPCCVCSCDWYTRPVAPTAPAPDLVCRTCAFIGHDAMPVTRWIAGSPYCFVHGMDIYCD